MFNCWNMISSLKPDVLVHAFSRGFLSCNDSAPMLTVPHRIIIIAEKSLLRFCMSIHTNSIIFAAGCVMWCQSFKESNFLVGNIEKTPKSPGLLHLKSTEIRPLTSVGAELGPRTKTAWPQRGRCTQTLLITRNNTFPKAVGRRACKYLNASPCATGTSMLCCPHSVLFMVSWEKERLSTPRKPSLSDKRGVFRWEPWEVSDKGVTQERALGQFEGKGAEPGTVGRVTGKVLPCFLSILSIGS